MVSITERDSGKSLAEQSMITEAVQINWPEAKDLPTSGEFAGLNRLIAARYPALAATDEKSTQQFWSAFIYMFFARRADVPNTKVSNDTWVQQANDWLAARGQGFTPTTARALVAAAICHGVSYSEPPWPKLGLAHGTRSEMQPSSWRKVLEVGQLPPPTAVARVWDTSIGTQQKSSVG
jgi:hypothetical protein